MAATTTVKTVERVFYGEKRRREIVGCKFGGARATRVDGRPASGHVRAFERTPPNFRAKTAACNRPTAGKKKPKAKWPLKSGRPRSSPPKLFPN